MRNNNKQDLIFKKAIEILISKKHDVSNYILDYERYGVEIINPSELLKYAISVEDNNLEFYENKSP